MMEKRPGEGARLNALQVVTQTPRELRLVKADQHRPILSNDPLHPVRGDQVRIHNVVDDLLDRPGTQVRMCQQLLPRQPGDSLADEVDAPQRGVGRRHRRHRQAAHGHTVRRP